METTEEVLMKKLNNGVVPPVRTFLFEHDRIAKEGTLYHENTIVARGCGWRAFRRAALWGLRC